MSAATVHASVVFATTAVQDVITVELPAGSTVAEAIAASGLLRAHGLDVAQLAVAVHGRRCGLERRVQEGDRLELLRPLVADPKEARRRRAARQGARGTT